MPTLYRIANISSKQATEELLAEYPGHVLEELGVEPATAETARHAKAQVGDMIFVAKVVKAGDEPEDEGPEPAFAEADDGPDEDAPPESPESPKEDKEEPKEESKPKDKPEAPKGEHEDKKMSTDEEIVHLLKQILDAVGGHSEPDGDELGPPAPKGVGPALPPPHAGPPGPPAGPAGPPKGPALPPPVEEKPAGAAFAHYDPKAPAFAVIRRNASELGLRGLRLEAESVYPTHRVAKLRTTGYAEIDGEEVYLPEAKLAIIELTRK